MNKIGTLILVAALPLCGKAFAVGVDVGPVHVHTGEVVVVHEHSKGDSYEVKIVVDKIVRDEDTKAVRKIIAHRKGDADDKFEIKVASEDLDDDSKDLVANKLKTDVIYKTRILKLEDNWKLLTIRKNDDD